MADPEKTQPSKQPPAQEQAPARAAAKRNILVINHTDSIHRIPIMGQSEDGPIASSHIVLLPGANAVEPAAWARVKDYPTIKALMKRKHRKGLEVGDPSVDVRDLASFTDEEEALELVDQTVDGTLLKTWLRTEKREKLVTAIEEQLKKIDPRSDLGKSEGEGEGGEKE